MVAYVYTLKEQNIKQLYKLLLCMYTVIQSKDLFLKKIQNVNWVQLHIVVNKHLFSIKNEIAYMYINSL